VLQPVRSELDDLAVQELTRRHLDELIVRLRAGSLQRPGGRARRAWSARSCNYMLGAVSQVLAQLVAEGRLARNVAALVDRVPGEARKFETFTADQVRKVLDGIANDRAGRGSLLLPAFAAVRSLAYVGMMSISPAGRCGSARLASMSEAAPSTMTTPRQPQRAACCLYPTPS
jgi:hypothetical protein